MSIIALVLSTVMLFGWMWVSYQSNGPIYFILLHVVVLAAIAGIIIHIRGRR